MKILDSRNRADTRLVAKWLTQDFVLPFVQHDLQVDYYGKRLATCSSDRLIKIFDVGPEPGQQTLAANIAGHDGPVWQASVESRGRLHIRVD